MVVKVSERDQAVVKKAAALIAKSPKLKPTAALQRLGIKSKPQIGRLRAALTTKAAASSVRKAKRKTSDRAQELTKTAALRVTGNTDVKREALASLAVTQPSADHVKREALDSVPVAQHPANHDVASFSPIALAVEAQFAFMKNVMRWTPMGMMVKMAIASNAAAWNFALPRRQ